MGYTTYGRFKGHNDLRDNHVEVLEEAFIQINDNLEFVEDYYKLSGHKKRRDGKCIIKRLTGKNKLKIKAKDIKGYALVIPIITLNTNRITFNKNYLSACYNSWKDADGVDGNKPCAIAELAGVIIHESAHTCLGTEKYAYLVDYYYRYRFRLEHGHSSSTCAAADEPPSWLPQDYKNKAAVKNVTGSCGFRFVEDTGIPTPNIPGINVNVKIGHYYLSC